MGTSFTNPIGRSLRPQYNESSRLRSHRDSDVVQRIWQKNSTAEQQLFRMSQSAEQMQRELNRLRIRKGDGVSARNNIFRIYQSDTWLKFKVMTGYVIATSDAFVPTSVETEFTITSGVPKFYFVLTILSASTGAITTSSTLPVWSVDVIPIGWVDTDTYSADSRSVIYQFLHDNVFSPCVT